MSGSTVSRGMRDRFESIRRAELERLGRKKLCGLADAPAPALNAFARRFAL